ncbi:MAG: C1 family peptidase [Bacteroidota bacterium]
MRPLLLFILLLLINFCQAQKLRRSALNLPVPSISHCTPVKDQHLSATCWSFSSTSLLESELLRMGKGEVDLSEMFIARYSMVRKVHRHLKLRGTNFFTPGGQFHDAVWVMKKYGLVPEEVFSGKGRGETNHNHSEMDTLLSYFVKECIANSMTSLSAAQQFFIDSVLDSYYGKIPASFFYKGKTYTPQTYLTGYLGINPDDYVEITSYSHHPWYSSFVLEDKYNWTGDRYRNVPLEDFSLITDIALDNGYSVGWDGDANDPWFDFNEGLAYMPEPVKEFPTARQTAFEDKTTELDHMMHIVGRTRKMGDTWYYIKNSWGGNNPLSGFMWMREDYFKMRTLAIIVNKAAIPADIRQKLEL